MLSPEHPSTLALISVACPCPPGVGCGGKGCGAGRKDGPASADLPCPSGRRHTPPCGAGQPPSAPAVLPGAGSAACWWSPAEENGSVSAEKLPQELAPQICGV